MDKYLQLSVICGAERKREILRVFDKKDASWYMPSFEMSYDKLYKFHHYICFNLFYFSLKKYPSKIIACVIINHYRGKRAKSNIAPNSVRAFSFSFPQLSANRRNMSLTKLYTSRKIVWNQHEIIIHPLSLPSSKRKLSSSLSRRILWKLNNFRQLSIPPSNKITAQMTLIKGIFKNGINMPIK